MPRGLQAILGKSSRVKKPAAKPRQPRRDESSPSPRKAKAPREDDDALFTERLEDHGLAKLLAEELTLRDVVQAMRYIRSRMFSLVPTTGLHSTRVADVLNYRAAMAPIVTVGHLNAVLSSPSKVEREMVELAGKGVIRKVRVERRGGMGEALIETADLEAMITKASVLSSETKRRFIELLRDNPVSQVFPNGALPDSQVDELIRAGFLTSSTQATPGTTLDVRPEDRTTLTSIQHVSKFASGTVSAVGGRNAIHLSGGGGGGSGGSRAAPAGSSSSSSDRSRFRFAVPGHGRYLKLAEGAVDWVREGLGNTKWGEGPETWLKERFEGGGLYGTRWKEFWGVEWEWVLGEAVGLGVVEVFDTASVGRGVRALGR